MMGQIYIAMVEIRDDLYESASGLLLQREYDGFTPNGNPMNGRWVLRGARGAIIDFGPSRNDIAERNNIRLQ